MWCVFVHEPVGTLTNGCSYSQNVSPTSSSQSGTLKSTDFTFASNPNSNMVYRATLANVSGLSRPIVIRSDPTMTTCFDPADKELYDLWAPKFA